MIVAIVITVYALSAFGAWRYIHLAHGPNGVWNWHQPNVADVAMVVFPVLNTISNMMWLAQWPIRRSGTNSDPIKKFFRIK
jgi:hypothetical protein